ncbi:hypothetical protein CHS0354_028012 [Potamilus streckersoni]|uniref:Fibrinogen C-terminal domain-containing protein n=1 Tax=Potamilus streckersoni TaxID=2493646 RepID=A0AAE0RMC5_9BIVA|nr:hypothetical protein CHS0354_028012 [Potamilus streckersoni]
MTHYIERELLQLKYSYSNDLFWYQNTTIRLERDIMDLKVKRTQDMATLKVESLEKSFIIDRLQKIESKVDDFILHLAGKNLKTYRHNGKVRKDRMVSNMTSKTDEQYLLGVLRGIVADLKAEWILVKKDLLDLKSKMFELNDSYGELRNATGNFDKEFGFVRAKCLDHIDIEESGSRNIYKVEAKMTNLEETVEAIQVSLNEMMSNLISTKSEVTNLHKEKTTLVKDIKDLQSQYSIQRKFYKNSAGGRAYQNTQGVPDVSTTVLEAYKSLPQDCQDIYDYGFRSSGVYQIKPSNATYLDNVYCEMVNGSGLTVFQRRADGLLSFNNGWLEYKVGFGNLYGDFWIGNDILHGITSQKNYALRVDMWDWEGNKAYAEYFMFIVDGESSKYMLHVSGYNGDAGDSLSYHNLMKFSTKDLDNDLHMRNCAADNKAGWWYNQCYSSHLNGVYHKGWYPGQSTFADGIVWYTLKSSERYSLRKVEMKLRRLD